MLKAHLRCCVVPFLSWFSSQGASDCRSHVSDFVSYTPHSSTTLRTCWGGLNTNSLTETFQNPDVIPNTSHCNVDTLLMFYCLSSTGLCFVTGHCHCIKAEHGRYWASTSAQEDYKMSSSLSGIQKITLCAVELTFSSNDPWTCNFQVCTWQSVDIWSGFRWKPKYWGDHIKTSKHCPSG